jgi:hypothetical protein
VHHEPAAIDGELHAGGVFGRAAAVAKQERFVDLLDMDTAVLDRLDGIGDFEDAARGLIRIGVRVVGGEFQAAALSSLSAPRATILIASSGNGR